MKKYLFVLFVFTLTEIINVSAQDLDIEGNYILIREDIVKPSMTIQYEAAMAELTDFLVKNEVSDIMYITQLQDDYSYAHVSVVNQIEQVEKGLRNYFKGTENEAEFELIWSYLNESIDSYKFSLGKFRMDLSYVPDAKIWLDKAPYRKWNYYYFKPGTEQQAEKIIAAWKSLYERKGVKSGFRVFQGLIGTEGPVYIFTTWGESPLDYQLGLQGSIKSLDGEGSELWMSMMNLVRKVETIEGWYLPQYSYIPE